MDGSPLVSRTAIARTHLDNLVWRGIIYFSYEVGKGPEYSFSLAEPDDSAAPITTTIQVGHDNGQRRLLVTTRVNIKLHVGDHPGTGQL